MATMTDRIQAVRRLGHTVGSKLSWLPPLVARVTVGWVFVHSGWGKLHNLDKVIEYFGSLGIPAPNIQAPFAAGTELVAGAAVLLGLLTRLCSLPLIAVMLVALVTAKHDDIDSVNALFGQVEYAYIVMLLYLSLQGAGLISLDALIARRLDADSMAGAKAAA